MQKTNPSSIFKTNALSFAAICCCLAFVAGCGDTDWSFVEGSVQINGESFGPGLISFRPKDPAALGGGIGEIGADGHYVVRSSGRKEGLASGEYLIAISEKLSDETDEAVAKRRQSRLPAKYRGPTTSGLTRTVEPGKQTIDFNLDE